ncbi:MAG: rod shape-determining protein MreD [Solirubrobacteraceae bacterium]
MKDFSYSLWIRIAIVAFFAVVLQVSVVAQISIFGVNADITPLVVMSIGLLAGSLPGAVAGFGIGLLVDLSMVQTLGVSSLLFIAIGYWSGRLRELRDPAHGLMPLAAGATATLVAGLGMAVIQFMLDSDAPVSWLLLQEIILQVLVNSLLALPVYELVRRLLYRAIPSDRSRRQRRSYSSGALSPLQRPSERYSRAAGR